MRVHTASRKMFAAAILASALVFTACSTSTDSGEDFVEGDAPTTGAAGDGYAEAEALVESLTERPTSINVDTPVSKPIPTGKKIAFMNCGQEACVKFGEAIDAAGKVLGWTTEQVNAGITPESVQAAWDKVVRDKPDAVIASGYPSAMFAEQLAELAEAGVPVVECCVPDETAEGIIVMLGEKTYEKVSEAQAAWTTVATKGKANTVFVYAPEYPITKQQGDFFVESMARFCPDCPVDMLEVPAAEMGTTLPSKVVGYLRANPDVNYVALSYDGMAPGLPQALASAGLTGKVKFNGFNGLPVAKQYIADGEQDASVPIPNDEMWWMGVDALARHFVGDSVQINRDWDWPMFIYTQENMDDPTKTVPIVEDYQEQFRELWGKN